MIPELDLTALNLVDVLLAFIILLGVLSGWGRGFVVATLGLVTLTVSLVLALLGYHHPVVWLQAAAPTLGLWIAPLSLLATYLLAHLLIGAVASRLAGALPSRLHAHAINRTLGTLPGLIGGLINAAIAALLLLNVPLPGALATLADHSALASRVVAPAEWLEARLAPIFHPAVSRTLRALTVHPESSTAIKLSYKVDNPQPRPDLEARMLEMVNAERHKAGLKPLLADPNLAEVARAHSRDMFARSYFAHVSPEGQDVSDRMRHGKVRHGLAGENLALAPTLAGAHQGLMNSPGHRANILRAQYGHVGIGVLDGRRYGLMVTQNFRN
ncbi:MAG: putative rane protein [Polaromonas sp.]|nr:putative rane protein [Polaromonas sp.]